MNPLKCNFPQLSITSSLLGPLHGTVLPIPHMSAQCDAYLSTKNNLPSHYHADITVTYIPLQVFMQMLTWMPQSLSVLHQNIK
jgi:hypothetical protein